MYRPVLFQSTYRPFAIEKQETIKNTVKIMLNGLSIESIILSRVYGCVTNNNGFWIG
jgi:hypothetical protein